MGLPRVVAKGRAGRMLKWGIQRLTHAPRPLRVGLLGDERATSTLVAAALIPVMLLLGVVLHDVTVLYAAHSQAQTAADAAAKAAGLELTPLFGVGNDPRRAADGYASRNGCRVAACDFGGDGRYLWVTVRAVRGVHQLILKPGGCEVTATARCYLDLDPP